MMEFPYVETDDAFLVNETRRGKTGAFELLVGKYHRRVGVIVFQKVSNRQDAEDIVQETFTKAFAALGQLKEPSKFGAWIYQIAGKTIIDFYRKRAFRQTASIEEMREQDWELAAEETEKLDTEVFGKVMKELNDLPDDYRIVVTLRYLEGMNSREIADHLGKPHGTIRNRLYRANAILRDKLEGLQY